MLVYSWTQMDLIKDGGTFYIIKSVIIRVDFMCSSLIPFDAQDWFHPQ